MFLLDGCSFLRQKPWYISLVAKLTRECLCVLSMSMSDESFHRIKSNMTIIGVEGFRRKLLSCGSDHTFAREGIAMVSRVGYLSEFMKFIPIYLAGTYCAGCLIKEGCRGKILYICNRLITIDTNRNFNNCFCRKHIPYVIYYYNFSIIHSFVATRYYINATDLSESTLFGILTIGSSVSIFLMLFIIIIFQLFIHL